MYKQLHYETIEVQCNGTFYHNMFFKIVFEPEDGLALAETCRSIKNKI
jgi:hypothetical protein